MGACTLFHDGHGFYEHHISAAGGFGPLQRCKVWHVMKELHAGSLEREAASTSCSPYPIGKQVLQHRGSCRGHI